MDAITLYQPYGHLIVVGLKGIETRPRRTHKRGRIAIHAAARTPPVYKAGYLEAVEELHLRDQTSQSDYLHCVHAAESPALGAVIGTVALVDCIPVEEVRDTLTPMELAFGDYSPGRWAWIMKYPFYFPRPCPAKGHQGWWKW